MTQKRSKLLYMGITGKYDDTLKGQVFRFAGTVALLLVTLIFVWLSLEGYIYFEPFKSKIYAALIFSVPAILIITWLFISPLYGLEVDAIYENGITNRHTALSQRIMGKSFQPFESISSIGYGKTIFNGKEIEFVIPFEKKYSRLGIRPYTNIKNKYKNNFYTTLITILKEKCPAAKWIEVKWENLLGICGRKI
jgi:hypothetical protein